MIAPDDDEIRFKSVINLLKHTSKVSAPPGFEADLMRRINLNNYSERNKVKWWENILIPSRIVPSVSPLAVVIIFFVLNFNTVEREDPFFATPKMRETLNTGRAVKLQDISRNDQGFTAASLNQSFAINKDGLNFLQIRLTDAERTRINLLKTQIRQYLKENLSGKK